ncbi:MAG: SDR family NAD(P)-dependent oxidoreductase [Myxococcota bacterium]
MKRILVTGANKGIGLAIVGAILEGHEGTSVWLGSRDPARGEAARRGLVEAHPDWADRVQVLPLDVTDDDSVVAAHAAVMQATPEHTRPLYGLVNNAGVAGQDLVTTLAVNTMGLRRVSEAFLPLLQPAGGRIVNVTSASGPNFVAATEPKQRWQFTDAACTREAYDHLIEACLNAATPAGLADLGFGQDAYGLSKALANVYTMILAREHPALKINACTPGFIETDLTRPYAAASGRTPEEMGMKAPAEGARAPLHLLFGELEGNGWYYGSDAQRSPLDRYRAPGDPPYTGD